ncbi:MAG: DUF2478 domain-containing protein [Bradyrhizobium sp.]|uniref:DUF2478 domain-containing protein n=1 Tax=Bradyrhizobium sp. TaxID=376 RepID=UPI003C7DB70E
MWVELGRHVNPSFIGPTSSPVRGTRLAGRHPLSERLGESGCACWRGGRGGALQCDVILDDLSTGLRSAIFENRGAGASSCRLDESALTGVAVRVASALESAPDVLVLNKFGKAECEGRGLRHLIAVALDREIPVLIGVPKGQSFRMARLRRRPRNGNRGRGRRDRALGGPTSSERSRFRRGLSPSSLPVLGFRKCSRAQAWHGTATNASF